MTNYAIIYHANCTDGMTAAGIAKFYLEHNMNVTDIEMIEGRYHSETPNVHNKTIYFVDFSYKLDAMEELLSKGNTIVLIDHHKSAIEDLAPLRDHPSITFFVSEDNSQSGTGLAWEYFTLTKDMPLPFEYIQDRDLWTWKHINSKNYLAYLDIMERSIDSYCLFVKDTILESNTEAFHSRLETETNIGKSIAIHTDQLCRDAIRTSITWVNFGEYTNIPVVNCSGVLTSDIGSIITNELYTDVLFAVMWQMSPQGIKFGLRSKADKSRTDVSEVAQKINQKGGGHYCAAGSLVKTEDILSNIYAKAILGI